MQGARVQTLVGELRFHMLHGVAKKKKKTLKKKEKLFSNIIELNSLALVRIYCKRYIYGRRETTGDALMKVKLV